MDFIFSIIEACLQFFSLQFGINQALAIVLFTLAAKLLFLPISFKAALDNYKNKLKVEQLKPELEQLKAKYKENPVELSRQNMTLFKSHNISFFNKTTFANLLTQGGLGIALFSALKNISLHAKILWISNIAKPDILLSIVVGVITYISMIAMPSSGEQSMVLLFLVPTILSFIVLSFSPAAIGLFWATSTLFTTVQNIFLRV